MSINWSWENKIGTAKDKFGNAVNIYKGNAPFIALYEWTENEDNFYTLVWFFADKEHAKNCLGLSKEYKSNSIDIYNFEEITFNEYDNNIKWLIELLCKAKRTKPLKITIDLK